MGLEQKIIEESESYFGLFDEITTERHNYPNKSAMQIFRALKRIGIISSELSNKEETARHKAILNHLKEVIVE